MQLLHMIMTTFYHPALLLQVKETLLQKEDKTNIENAK
jgi:hypothetical protein